MIERLHTLIDRTLWRAGPERSRALGVLRVVARYPYAIIRDAVEGQLTMRAMSLVYTTLLSMVPLIALVFSVLKGFDVHHQVEPVLQNFLSPLGQTQAGELTQRVIGFVDNQRGVALGSFGFVFLLYTVISMVQKVEESLNYVWQVQRQRSFARRFSEYLSILLVAPVIMLTATSIVGAISSDDFVAKILETEVVSQTVLVATKLVPVAMVSLVFTFIYMLMPNTRVQFRAAAAGGLCAGALWVSVGALFASFVANSASYTAIYTTFATVILALLWLYANWLILLVGAKVSFYVQHPELLRFGHRPVVLGSALEERSAVQAMLLVAAAFTDGTDPPTVSQLAETMGIPGRALSPVLTQLEACQLVVVTDKDRVLPARALHTVSVYDVLSAVRDRPGSVPIICDDSGQRSASVVERVLSDIDSARERVACDLDLQSLVARARADAETPDETVAPVLGSVAGNRQ